jgi:type I restriction enzyme S subunit
MSKMAETDIRKKESGSPLMPKLRFPEFRVAEGWDQVSLKSIADPVRERAVQSENNEVLSLSAEYGLVLQGDFFGKKVAGDNVERYLKIVRNDFVYNDRATKATAFGTIKRLSKYASGIVSPIYKCFRFGNQEDSAFWECYFESGVHDIALRGLVNEGARAGRFNISISQFLSTIASRPEIAEQQRISACLSALDELIAVQAQKVEALKSHKKGLMQELFPHEGETRPRLRFPEFQGAGEWVATRLGMHVAIKSGNSPSVYGLSSSGLFPFVKVEDLNNCIKYQASAREFCDDSDGVVPSRSILFPKRGAAIQLNKIRITTAEILIDTNLMALTPSDDLMVEFLYYLLSYVGLSHLADTSTVPQINNKHIVPFFLRLPKEDEQLRIASCLSKLDTLITAEIQKLEALRAHKKGLMQQLFPSAEEVEA